MRVLLKILIENLERLWCKRRAPLPLLAALGAEQIGKVLMIARLEAIGILELGLLHPLLQHGLDLCRRLGRDIELFEATNGRLTVGRSFGRAERLTHLGLRETERQPTQLERLGKLAYLVQVDAVHGSGVGHVGHVVVVLGVLMVSLMVSVHVGYGRTVVHVVVGLVVVLEQGFYGRGAVVAGRRVLIVRVAVVLLLLHNVLALVR